MASLRDALCLSLLPALLAACGSPPRGREGWVSQGASLRSATEAAAPLQALDPEAVEELRREARDLLLERARLAEDLTGLRRANEAQGSQLIALERQRSDIVDRCVRLEAGYQQLAQSNTDLRATLEALRSELSEARHTAEFFKQSDPVRSFTALRERNAWLERKVEEFRYYLLKEQSHVAGLQDEIAGALEENRRIARGADSHDEHTGEDVHGSGAESTPHAATGRGQAGTLPHAALPPAGEAVPAGVLGLGAGLTYWSLALLALAAWGILLSLVLLVFRLRRSTPATQPVSVLPRDANPPRSAARIRAESGVEAEGSMRAEAIHAVSQALSAAEQAVQATLVKPPLETLAAAGPSSSSAKSTEEAEAEAEKSRIADAIAEALDRLSPSGSEFERVGAASSRRPGMVAGQPPGARTGASISSSVAERSSPPTNTQVLTPLASTVTGASQSGTPPGAAPRGKPTRTQILAQVADPAAGRSVPMDRALAPGPPLMPTPHDPAPADTEECSAQDTQLLDVLVAGQVVDPASPLPSCLPPEEEQLLPEEPGSAAEAATAPRHNLEEEAATDPRHRPHARLEPEPPATPTPD